MIFSTKKVPMWQQCGNTGRCWLHDTAGQNLISFISYQQKIYKWEVKITKTFSNFACKKIYTTKKASKIFINFLAISFLWVETLCKFEQQLTRHEKLMISAMICIDTQKVCQENNPSKILLQIHWRTNLACHKFENL